MFFLLLVLTVTTKIECNTYAVKELVTTYSSSKNSNILPRLEQHRIICQRLFHCIGRTNQGNSLNEVIRFEGALLQ